MSDSKQIKVKRAVRVLQAAVVMVCALVVFGNGCSEGGFYPEGSADIASTLEASCKDPNEIDVIPGAKTASLVGSTNIAAHLSSCTGLESVSAKTQAVLIAKVAGVSTYGAVNSLTPPMMMAVHSIAGEVCNDVVDQEITRGTRIFAGWDLNASTLPSDSMISAAATNLALSCWKDYDISSAERDIVVGAISSSIGTSEVAASRKAAVMMCTAMLASLNAILN